MRIKKIGAILAGAVMIGSAVAAAWDPAENEDFFVDSETGEPNAIVVVGANAVASDVTAAGWIAAQIGNMAFYEEVTRTPITKTWNSLIPYIDDQGDNLNDQLDTGANNADVILVGDSKGYFNSYPPYDELSTLWWEDWDPVAWNYATPSSIGYGVLNEWEKREEIYVNLTHDWRWTLDGDGTDKTLIYPVISASPLYGFEYRVILEHFPDQIIWFGGEYNYTPYYLYENANTIKFLCDFYDLLGVGTDSVLGDYIYYGTPHFSKEECRGDDEFVFLVGDTKEFYGWEVTLDDINIYENKVQWLIKAPNDDEVCEYITVISGYDSELTWDSMIRRVDIVHKDGEPDWNIVPDEENGTLTYSLTFDGMLSYHYDSSLPNYELVVPCAEVGGTPNPWPLSGSVALPEESGQFDISAQMGWINDGADYDGSVYGAKIWYVPEGLFNEAGGFFEGWSNSDILFEVDLITPTMSGIEYYNGLVGSDKYKYEKLITEGFLSERCFNAVQGKACEYDVIGITDTICGTEDITVFALDTVKTFLGTEHNKAVARLYALEDYGIIHDAVCIKPCGADSNQWALDVSLWKYDVEYGDYANTLYCPDAIYDDFSSNDGDPDFRDGYDEAFISMKMMDVIDVRVCGSARTLALCCWDMPQCGVDSYWVNTGDAPKYIDLLVDDSGDLAHTNLIIEGGFSVTHYSGEIVTVEMVPVDIDPMSIVVNDNEVTDTMKATRNLILVGGCGLVVCVGAEPQTANKLTKELVDLGLSVVDWFTTAGEYEYVADAFAEGRDVIIVAGADREATKVAVQNLLNDLKA